MGWADDKQAAPVVSDPTAGGWSADQQNTNFRGTAGPPAPEQRPVANFGAGINEAIANTLGMPVDLMNNPGRLALATNPILKLLNQIHPNPALDQPLSDRPIGGSKSIEQLMGTIGANPADVPANTPEEKIARATGTGVGSTVMPWMLGSAGLLGKTLSPVLAGPETKGVPGLLAQGGQQAVVGGTGGAAGGTLKQFVGEDNPYAPWVDMLGNLAGGLGAGSVMAAGKAVINKAGEFFEPFTARGQAQIAGRQLRTQATNPNQVIETIGNQQVPGAGPGTARPGEVVPGSAPTTYQLTGDTGLGQLERKTETANPAPFIDRRTDQNAARVAEIGRLEPDTSNPAAVQETFRQHLAAMDQQQEAALQAAQQNAQREMVQLGGQASTETYGNSMRAQMETAKEAFKRDVERPAWQAIDPNGTLTINGTPTSRMAARIIGEMPDTAKPMSAEEADIFRQAQGIGPQTTTTPAQTSPTLKDAQGNPLVLRPAQTATTTGETPFQDFAALRSRLNDAIREERSTNGETQAWRRMVMLRGSMDDTMATTVGQQSSTWDAAAAQRYRDAADATINRKTTFNAGQPGAVLQTAPVAGYRVPDERVAGRLLQSPETVRGYLAAGGDQTTLHNAAVNDLRSRSGVINPDGTLNVGRYNGWLSDNRDVVDAIPGLRARLGTAADAQQAVDQLTATTAQQTRDFQQGAARHFLNNEDPVNAVGAAFGRGDPVANMRDLVAQTQNNPDARAGLRRAVVDYMQRNFLSNTESGTSGQAQIAANAFQNFVKKQGMALGELFSGDELQSMQNVADDIMRANRSQRSTNIPGRSTTAQDTQSFLQALHGHLSTEVVSGGAGLLSGGALAGSGHPVAAGLAVLGGAATAAAKALQRQGISKADELVTEALLDPNKARALMMDAKEGNVPFFTQQFGSQAASLGAGQAVQQLPR